MVDVVQQTQPLFQRGMTIKSIRKGGIVAANQVTHVFSTHGLLTRRKVKRAGYWPSYLFCVFMVDRDDVEVHKHARKERGQYLPILTEQDWSTKDLLHGIKHLKKCLILRDQARNPERAI